MKNNIQRWRILISLYATALFFLTWTTGLPSGKVIDDLQFVYDWTSEHCPKHPDRSRCLYSYKCRNITEQNLNLCRDCDPDVVDAPTKAFRRTSKSGNEETVLLGSVNWGSRAQIGPTLNMVRHTCDVYYNKTWIQQDSMYASREWIQGTWAFPNQTVVALTHMEHHNLTTGAGDFSAVTLLHSLDGGRTWDRARKPPAHVIAASPLNYSLGGNRLGFRSPSNILEGRDGFYYATVTSGWGNSDCSQFVDPLKLQHFCTCIMRTQDLTDPHAWKAWDGHTFNTSLAGTPWDVPPAVPSRQVCQPITEMTYPSILWSTYFNKYIMLGTTQGRDHAGWSFQLSDNLIHWSNATALEVHSFDPKGNTTYNLYAYPSLLDPESSRQNYDRIGKRGFLYLIGRKNPLPRVNHSYYLVQDILRVMVQFDGAQI